MTALSIVPGQKVVSFTDYAGRNVQQKATYFVNKLSKDVDHASFASWLPATLRDPVEVWVRAHVGKSQDDKRHYLSAYRDGANTLTHVAVVVAKDGTFITAFRKVSTLGLDSGVRAGILEYKSYK